MWLLLAGSIEYSAPSLEQNDLPSGVLESRLTNPVQRLRMIIQYVRLQQAAL
jgi:hypothetical protein